MDINAIVEAFVSQGVSSDIVRDYFTSVGLQDDPLVIQILNHLTINEIQGIHPMWDIEDANDVLAALGAIFPEQDEGMTEDPDINERLTEGDEEMVEPPDATEARDSGVR